MHKKIVLCSFVLWFLSSTAFASIATHFSEVSFAASSGPTLLESFEGLTPIPASAYPGSATSYLLTDFNLAISGTGLTMGVYNMPNAGTYATDGANFIGAG